MKNTGFTIYTCMISIIVECLKIPKMYKLDLCDDYEPRYQKLSIIGYKNVAYFCLKQVILIITFVDVPQYCYYIHN